MTTSKQVTQQFLDSAQYRAVSILHYEAVYGEDFVSPGGSEMAIEMIGRLQLAEGSRVLDVGCGLGGSAFIMAREFGLQVDGIDLSRNMLALAGEKLKANGLSDQVSLQWGDCLELEPVERFDAVYSRDVFLHIHDKARLFSVLQSVLKPAGKLLFTDYCCAARPWHDDFAAYVAQRNYSLHSVDEYAEIISAAGFEDVDAVDLTEPFGDILRADLDRIEALQLDSKAREELRHSWQQKLARAQSGQQRWGRFSAVKPEV